MKTDYEISLEAKKENIEDVAAKIGIEADKLIKYGDYKAKIKRDGFDNQIGRASCRERV